MEFTTLLLFSTSHQISMLPRSNASGFEHSTQLSGSMADHWHVAMKRGVAIEVVPLSQLHRAQSVYSD